MECRSGPWFIGLLLIFASIDTDTQIYKPIHTQIYFSPVESGPALSDAGLVRYSSSYLRHTAASRAIFLRLRIMTSCWRSRRSASIMEPMVMPLIWRKLVACEKMEALEARLDPYTLNWNVNPRYTGLKA